MKSDHYKWVLLTATAPMIWGTTYVVTVLLLPESSPVWSSVFRALPAGLVGLLIVRQFPSGEWIWKSLIMALLNIGLFFPLLFIAAYRLPGGIASILSAFQPFFVMALAWMILHEASSAVRYFFAIVGVLGVTLMVVTAQVALDIIGIAAGIAAILSMSFGIVLTKKWSRPVGGGVWAVWLLTWAGIVLLPAAFLLEGAPPPVDKNAFLGYTWLSLVGALFSYICWFIGLGKIQANTASFLPLLSPLTATTLGIVILGEQLTVVQWIGFVLCLVSIVLSQLKLEKS